MVISSRPTTLSTILALAMLTACKLGDRERKQSTPELPPLAAPPSPTTLPVKGFGDAVIAAPAGATRAMPVLVAVLGVADTPEEQCAVWREIAGPRAFVLCPRGAPHMVQEEVEVEDASAAPASDVQEEDRPNARPDGGRVRQVGFHPVDLATLDREVSAGLSALKARYGAHVAEHDVVYAGFSRGAFLGASLAARYPDRFARLVLIEGGHSPWQSQTAASFAKGGGKRVLFVCGQPSCVEDAESAAATLRSQRVETRIVHGSGEGHGYRKQVKEELRRSFDWVTEGDPRWRQLLAQ